jgi:hypothetical protein
MPDWLPDDAVLLTLAPRMVCTACGLIDVRPDSSPIAQLQREGSPPSSLRLLRAQLSRNSNQIDRGRIRRIAVG